MAELATLTLGPGRYYAGLTRPWFVTQNDVRAYAERLGFVGVEFHSRRSPPPVNPRIDVRYRDDWEEWASADYGLSKRAPMQIARRWAWLVRTPAKPGAALPSSRAGPPSPEPASSLLWVVLPPLGLLGWALLRRVRP